MASKRGQRHLTPEERELWAHVTKHDQRLDTATEMAAAAPKPEPAVIAPVVEKTPPVPTNGAAAPLTVRPAAPKTLEPFDARLARRLARGQKTFDARLDLHGLRQNDAHAELRAFLARCQTAHFRQVLVITGKGAREDEKASDIWEENRRGVLRRLVPLWLAQPEFRMMVVGFREAALHHGGSGALYVMIRRLKI